MKLVLAIIKCLLRIHPHPCGTMGEQQPGRGMVCVGWAPAGSGAPAEHPGPTPNSGSSCTRAGTTFCTMVHNVTHGQGAFPLAAVTEVSVTPHSWLCSSLGAQVGIEIDQFIYFASDVPFSPLCSFLFLIGAVIPHAANLLLSGPVPGAASGLGWDGSPRHRPCVLYRAVSDTILCMHPKVLILAVRYSGCFTDCRSWDPLWSPERKGSSWIMAHAGVSVATSVSRCVQRSQNSATAVRDSTRGAIFGG